MDVTMLSLFRLGCLLHFRTCFIIRVIPPFRKIKCFLAMPYTHRAGACHIGLGYFALPQQYGLLSPPFIFALIRLRFSIFIATDRASISFEKLGIMRFLFALHRFPVTASRRHLRRRSVLACVRHTPSRKSLIASSSRLAVLYRRPAFIIAPPRISPQSAPSATTAFLGSTFAHTYTLSAAFIIIFGPAFSKMH